MFLIVDDDDRVRSMMHFALELEGLTVAEAGSLVEARLLLGPHLAGIVLDRQLPDGDGLDLLPDIGRASPDARVVVCSALNDGREPAGMPRVDKADVNGLLAMFGLGDAVEHDDPPPFATTAEHFRDLGRFGDYVRADIAGLTEDWQELCRWDPELAVDTWPAGAEGFVAALADALDRPQPLGWGVDPAVEEAALLLAEGAPSASAAIAQLVCLREALSRRLLRTLVIEEAAEVLLRATMALERGMATVVNAVSARLEQEVFLDVLTSLPNRRAFQRDLAKQLAWANRSRHSLALVLIDLDGLKAINDSQGYAAGDARLRTLAAALAAAVRAGDGAYRVGGDEFVALLPDSPPSQVPAILRRAVRLAAPAFSWGVATFPADGHTVEELLDVAHDDLARRRGRPRSQASAKQGSSRREMTS
jgi:diguanylate cyclase (GGDEF)-like protein